MRNLWRNFPQLFQLSACAANSLEMAWRSRLRAAFMCFKSSRFISAHLARYASATERHV